MVIILNNDGIAHAIEPSTLVQGQNNSSTITVIGPSLSAITIVEIGFRLPDGNVFQWKIPDSEQTTPYLIMTKNTEVPIDGVSHPIYNYIVPGCLTNQHGTLEVYFNISDVLGNTTSYQVDMNIQESVVTRIYEQEENPSTVQYLLDTIESIQTTAPSIVNRNQVPYRTLEGVGGTNTGLPVGQNNAAGNTLIQRTPSGRAVVADGVNDNEAVTKAQLDTKADKSTTISGYDISDAYTKTEVDTALNLKIDKSKISSSTGSSTENVMSQAAITDAINAVANNIPTNGSFTLSGLSEKSYNSLTDRPTIPTNSTYVDLTTTQSVTGTKTFTIVKIGSWQLSQVNNELVFE